MSKQDRSENGGRGRPLPQAGQGPEGPQGPQEPQISAWRLLTTLGSAGALAGLLIVFVHQVTQPAIIAHKAEVLRQAVQEVLGAPDHYDTLYVRDGELLTELPEGVDPRNAEMVFQGFREDGSSVGFAITGAEPGFQDVIELIFGFDPEASQVLGMKVLSSRETPGLGDKIEKDQAFISEFEGVETPLQGVKPRRATGAPGEVDMITGATISSRTVIDIINGRLEELGPMLEAHSGEGE